MRISDWSSDVCSADLLFGSLLPGLLESGADIVFGCDPRLVPLFARSIPGLRVEPVAVPVDAAQIDRLAAGADVQAGLDDIGAWLRADLRSEARRAGKECGRTCASRGEQYHLKK